MHDARRRPLQAAVAPLLQWTHGRGPHHRAIGTFNRNRRPNGQRRGPKGLAPLRASALPLLLLVLLVLLLLLLGSPKSPACTLRATSHALSVALSLGWLRS